MPRLASPISHAMLIKFSFMFSFPAAINSSSSKGAPPSSSVPGLVAEDVLESAGNALLVLGEVVDDSVGAGIERVAADDLARSVVDGVTQPDGRAGGVVHVEDWRRGVEAGGVEVVRVLHGQHGESLEVAVEDGLLHCLHAFGHDVVGALLEEGGGGDGGLHAAGGGDVLLFGAGYQDAGAHVGPVAGGCDLVGQAVTAVVLLALLPAGVAAEQTPASGAGALAGDLAEVGWGCGELVEVRNGANESGEACSAGGQAGGCGEVVLGHDLELEVGELGLGVVAGLDILSQLAELAEACLGAGARDVLVLAVQGERVLGEFGRAGGGGVSAEVILGEVNADSVSVCLAKWLIAVDVLDDGDVDGGESARAVDLLGGHICGIVNVVVGVDRI
ncbi:3358_t:CDS:2, partial [Scutellospora calospora]